MAPEVLTRRGVRDEAGGERQTLLVDGTRVVGVGEVVAFGAAHVPWASCGDMIAPRTVTLTLFATFVG